MYPQFPGLMGVPFVYEEAKPPIAMKSFAYVEVQRLEELERKLDRLIYLVERLEKWFGPEFDEEGNVIK